MNPLQGNSLERRSVATVDKSLTREQEENRINIPTKLIQSGAKQPMTKPEQQASRTSPALRPTAVEKGKQGGPRSEPTTEKGQAHRVKPTIEKGRDTYHAERGAPLAAATVETRTATCVRREGSTWVQQRRERAHGEGASTHQR